jgi:hypothetical protein
MRSIRFFSPAFRVLAVMLLVSLGCAGAFKAVAAPAAVKIHHVFIIVLENEGFETTFGPHSPAVYLNSLTQRGALLDHYYGIGHASLDNYIAMISGQGPNPVTQGDCQSFVDFDTTKTARNGQVIGRGCVYPASTQTIAGQLERKGLSWKAYEEDMGGDPARESAVCGHPALGAADGTQHAEKNDQYATRHNPFVYFHGIIDKPACAAHVVNLTALRADLKSADQTPNYAFITPNLCHDGHDGAKGKPCVDGEPGGLVSADAFLRGLVPDILASPAFKDGGLLIVTFDESDLDARRDPVTKKVTLTGGDAEACCEEPASPNIAAGDKVFGAPDRGPGIFGPGGGRIGAVLISSAVAPGTVSHRPYNHYALLRTIEDLFRLKHLGYAGQPGLQGFGPDVFTVETR